MTCDQCGKGGKRFTMYPSRKRMSFMDQLCPKCSTLRKYEDARLAQAQRSPAIPCK